MSRPFLFGGSSQTTHSKYLVEFKAGKMNMEGSTVTPVNRKGTVFLHQTDDSLIHFCWKDRTSGQTEDDLIIFPDDAEFKRVTQCTTGRVYVLKFKTNPRRIFYWMQEPNEDKDDEYCQKINDYINNPPTPGSNLRSSERISSGGGNLGGSLSDLGSFNDADLQNLFNNVSPQQLMQMIGGVGGLQSGGLASLLGAHSSPGGGLGSGRSRTSGTGTGLTTSGNSSSSSGASTTSTGSNNQAPRTSSSVSGSGTAVPIQLSDLQSIISGLQVPPATSNTSSNPQVDLSTSINYEALKPLLSNESFMARVKEYLPPQLNESGQAVAVDANQVPEQLAATVASPQFQQALSLFSAALQSGQLGPLIAQFSLGEECVTAANNGDLEGFVRALEKNAKQSPSQASSSEDKKSDDMALD